LSEYFIAPKTQPLTDAFASVEKDYSVLS